MSAIDLAVLNIAGTTIEDGGQVRSAEPAHILPSVAVLPELIETAFA